MKALRILIAIVFLLPVCALRAEIEERALMSVNVPFAFIVENVRLPAGHYVIYAIDRDHLWRLNSFHRGGNTFFHIVSDDKGNGRPSPPKLIFRRYDKEYVLHEVDDGTRMTKATLFVRDREKQLARSNSQPEIAMIEAQPE